MTGAPEWTWFHAIVYLADIHNHTWNEEKQCIPATARDGKTKDISRFLQFYFFERVLYLDADDKLPNALKSTERPGYMLGFSRNVGDELTFKILDNQTKRVVSVSVVRPYKDNKRVQFDPQVKQNECLIKRPIDIDKLETRYKLIPSDQDGVPDHELIMDQYDKFEPDLDLPTPPTEPQVRSMNTNNPNQLSSLKKKYHQQESYPGVDLSPPPNMDAFYPIIKNEDDKASENDTVLRFSKGPLPQAKALQPPVLQAKKHPPNI